MLSENKDYEFGSTSEALITILKKLKEFEGRLTLISGRLMKIETAVNEIATKVGDDDDDKVSQV